MKAQSSSFSARAWSLPPAAMGITLVVYLLLNIGLAFLMPVYPLLGLIGAVVINLVVLFFLRVQLTLPFYILVAGPSVALSLASSGILSRLYIGNLMFALVVVIWLLRVVLPERKSGKKSLHASLLIPLVLLNLIGLISIIYSRLFPDPTVTYSFPHSNAPILLVNLSEMVLLIGLPLFLLVVPGVVRSLSDAKLVIGAYIIIGLIYALGTIFAGPLGLSSSQVILGIHRPQVFGSVSSALGTLLVLFSCIAFGQALYAKTVRSALLWGALSLIFFVGVVLAFGREAWIELFLAVVLMVGLRTRNWSILLVTLLPVALLLIPGVSDFFDPTRVYGSDRLKIWQDAIVIWGRSPLMGVGAGNYQFFDLVYGKDVVGIAHNQYLQVLAEMGVQGLVCLLWIIVAIGRLTFKQFSAAKTGLGKALSSAYCGFYMALVFGGMFTSTFIPSAAAGGGTGPFVEASYRWLLLGLVLSIPNWE